MPNKETFSIRPIRELIDKYREEGMVIVDPFARNSDIGTITNDLDPDTKAMYHKDAGVLDQVLEEFELLVCQIDGASMQGGGIAVGVHNEVAGANLAIFHRGEIV